MNPRFRGDEAGQGNGKALEDVKTVLRIRPGDPNARILSVQLLAEKIPPADWAAIWHEKGPDRKRVDRAIREVFDPGEKLCASIVADHPGNSDAWIQWTLLKWFRGFLEAKGGEDDDLIEPGLLHERRVGRMERECRHERKPGKSAADGLHGGKAARTPQRGGARGCERQVVEALEGLGVAAVPAKGRKLVKKEQLYLTMHHIW